MRGGVCGDAQDVVQDIFDEMYAGEMAGPYKGRASTVEMLMAIANSAAAAQAMGLTEKEAMMQELIQAEGGVADMVN